MLITALRQNVIYVSYIFINKVLTKILTKKINKLWLKDSRSMTKKSSELASKIQILENVSNSISTQW